MTVLEQAKKSTASRCDLTPFAFTQRDTVPLKPLHLFFPASSAETSSFVSFLGLGAVSGAIEDMAGVDDNAAAAALDIAAYKVTGGL